MAGNEKIFSSLAISELFLDDAKVEILLISWHFFGAFLVAPNTRPFIDTLIFWYIKGFQVIHNKVKFHLCLVCSSGVLKFQSF